MVFHPFIPQVQWRGVLKTIPASRIIFADKIKDNNVFRDLTADEKLQEKKNFAQCAMALLTSYPKAVSDTSVLPTTNQCSFHCQHTCNTAWVNDINSNCVACSSLPAVVSGTANSPEYITSHSMYDEEFAAHQLMSF